uniref:Lipocalin n=1 Tax=Amblyomma maculatum TaxID=34609 RepID=G3MKU2_AMBMU
MINMFRSLIFIYVFSGITRAATKINRKACNSESILDGWTFFWRNMTFRLEKSNYELCQRPDECVCVMSYFHPLKTGNHSMRRTFTYSNRSSTYKVNGKKSASIWPVARLNMTFYQSKGKSQYNGMNSTLLDTHFGYELPPPQWRFLISFPNCSVVRWRGRLSESQESGTTESSGIEKKKWPKCELWTAHLQNGREDPVDNMQLRCCESIFKSKCETKKEYQVYNSTVCALPGVVFPK